LVDALGGNTIKIIGLRVLAGAPQAWIAGVDPMAAQMDALVSRTWQGRTGLSVRNVRPRSKAGVENMALAACELRMAGRSEFIRKIPRDGTTS